MFSHGLATDAPDFQGACEPLGVIGVNTCRRHRIYRRQLIMKGLPAKARSLFFKFGAQFDW